MAILQVHKFATIFGNGIMTYRFFSVIIYCSFEELKMESVLLFVDFEKELFVVGMLGSSALV